MKKDDERLYLSMQILTDYMDDQFSDYYFYRGNDPMVLEDVRLYYGQAEISEKFVYIVKPGYLQKAMENNCNIVLIGKVELPKITPRYHKSIIHIPKNERVEYILELIQNIFHKFVSFPKIFVFFIIYFFSPANKSTEISYHFFFCISGNW